MKRPKTATARFERAGLASAKQRYVLRLYISGRTAKSTLALKTLKELCEARLPGRYELEVIDVYQEPARAREDHVLAVPTVIRRSPLPPRRLIGDLSNEERVLLGLDLEPLAVRHAKAPETNARPAK